MYPGFRIPVGAPLVGALFGPNHARRGDFRVAHGRGVFHAPRNPSHDQATPPERSRPPVPDGRPHKGRPYAWLWDAALARGSYAKLTGIGGLENHGLAHIVKRSIAAKYSTSSLGVSR